MSYQIHQVKQAIAEGRDPAIIQEMIYEIQYNRARDNERDYDE